VRLDGSDEDISAEELEKFIASFPVKKPAWGTEL
jgi:hypothetical protein